MIDTGTRTLADAAAFERRYGPDAFDDDQPTGEPPPEPQCPVLHGSGRQCGRSVGHAGVHDPGDPAWEDEL